MRSFLRHWWPEIAATSLSLSGIVLLVLSTPTATAARRGWWMIGDAILLFALAALLMAVRRSREQIDTTLESVTDGFIRFDRRWRVVYVNALMEEINRLSRAQMIGQDFWSLFPAVLGTTLERELRRAVAEKVTVEFENLYEPFGRWYAIKGYPTADGGLTAFIRDITEQKAQREALIQSEATFRELADAMPQIVYANDEHGVVNFANRRWLEYTGQQNAKTEGLGPLVHPHDLPRMLEAWNAAKATVAPYEAEFRLRRASDGAYRWFLTRSVPVLDARGKAVKWFGTSTDIHDQKGIEQALVESEARYRQIAAESERQRRLYETVLLHIPDFVYVFSLDHKVLYANDALIRMWGRGVEGAIGKTFLEIGYEPWHAAMHDREIDEVRATRRSIRGEVPFHGTHGIRQYEYIFVPIIGADGEVEAVAGTTRDITDRLAAEERLRASEEQQTFLVRLSDTIRPLSDLMLVQAEACRVLGEHLSANRAMYFEKVDETFVIERDYANGVPHLAGRFPSWSFGARLVEDFRAGRTVVQPDVLDDPSLSAAEQAAYLSIQARSFVAVPSVKDGRCVAGLSVHSAEPRQWTPSEVALVEATAERTWSAVERARSEAALRVSEERFRTLFSTMDEGFCIIELDFDTDGRPVDYRIEVMNDAFERHTGMGGLVGRSIREAIPGLEPFWFETYGQVARTGDAARFIHQASSMGRWFEVSAFRLGGSGTRRVAIIFKDISSRIRADKEREQLLHQLQDLDRRKDEFLATLAHELRNPLAPLRNGLQLMAHADTGEASRRARQMMERQVTHLVRLVDDLLDVSRVTTGKLELRRELLDIRTVVTAEADAIRSAMQQAGLTLQLAVPEDPVLLHGDPVRLAQVISNLLTNAVKYAGEGGHVEVRVARDAEHLIITVTDNGIGIPSEMLESVFELFTQVDHSLEKTAGGLGIGLSLARGLVEMHGGQIVAQSEGAGRGTAFVVRLPLVPTARTTADAATTPAVPSSVSRRRVLVVDDNDDAADSLGQLLAMMGHEVRTAYDGEAGVALAEAFRPDVVLCDIGMPRVNGLTAARRIRATPWGRDTLLVALTGWGHEADRQRSAEAGFDLHLVKPVDVAALTPLLERGM